MILSKSEIREIIEDEIQIDCYDDEEIHTGWLTFMDDNIAYPFDAEYHVKRVNGKKYWKKVKVVNGDTEQSISLNGSFFFEVELEEIVIWVKLNELKSIKADEDTLRAIQVWKHRKL